jgi:hypothetical protein
VAESIHLISSKGQCPFGAYHFHQPADLPNPAGISWIESFACLEEGFSLIQRGEKKIKFTRVILKKPSAKR